MENEVGGQNLEPNECLPDSFEDPNFQNTRIGSISEFGKTPTFYDSLPGHCCDAEFCFSAVYSETEAAGGSSEWVFQLEAAPNQPLATMPTVPDIIPLLTGGSSETFQLEKEMGGQIRELNEFLPDSFQDPSLWDTGNDSIVEIGKTPTFHDSFHGNYRGVDFCFSSVYNETEATGGSFRWAFQLEGQTTQFPAYPIPNVSPLQIAPTEVLSGNMGSSEDSRILLASQEAFLEGHVFESNNLTVPACSDTAAPGRPLATILHTMPTNPHMVPHLIGGSSESTYPNLSGLVDPPHPQRASTQIPSENMRTLEDLSILLVPQKPFMEEYGFGSINQTIPSCSNSTPSQQLMMPPLIASQDTNSVRVKATNGHTTIAFYLSFASGIIQLKEEVSKRLGFELGNFNLKYKDADGDLISIACNDDVRDYLQLLTGNQEDSCLK
ncbi:hypothetical protein RHGRI_013642 [Rhododendron griersonianum]|uniref:PB1 domain-containing protein n=1 Tax=Rhododendron griersonianum TaxID=479676 RepID=A0AAV6K6U7_9ERIC|nr:hypothetical protein RHGRI_013642 [Rhododendron griersonianum]